MKTNHVVRAWKDQEYRQNLSAAERADLPAHPSGMIELTDADLGVVSGGRDTLGAVNTGQLCNTHLPCLSVHYGCITGVYPVC